MHPRNDQPPPLLPTGVFLAMGRAYSIQVQIYRAIGINSSRFPAKGDYFTKDADGLVGE